MSLCPCECKPCLKDCYAEHLAWRRKQRALAKAHILNPFEALAREEGKPFVPVKEGGG